MISKNSRETLSKLLYEDYITESEYNNKMQEISIKLKKRVRPQKISKLFNKQLDIDTLEDYDIYYLAKTLLEYPHATADIKPDKFFTEIEIEDFENRPDIDYSVNIDNQIVINDVTEILPNKMWGTVNVNGRMIKSWFDKGLPTYNVNTQRPTIKKNIKGKIKEEINVNSKSVQEIKELILKNEYFPVTLTFNILENGYERFKYDKETKQMFIDVDLKSEFDLIDGFHNSRAIIQALRDNPNINQMYKLDIYRIDEKSARKFINDKNKQNLFPEESESYYDTSDISTVIVDDLNNSGISTTNLIKDNIGKDFDDVDLLNKYCSLDTLTKALKNNFDELDKKTLPEIRKLKEFLIDYFNELISILKSDFDDVSKSRKTSYATSNNMFYGYVALASKLYGQDKWQDTLLNIISNINFDKKNGLWRGKSITTKEIVNKQVGVLYNYFKNLYDVSLKKIETDKEEFEDERK